MHYRSPGPHPGEKLRGLAWGSLQAHTGGVLQTHSKGGLQAHTWGGGGLSQHALRQTPKQTATTAGGTHPTGIHSCSQSIRNWGRGGWHQRILWPNFAENCKKVKKIVREGRPIFYYVNPPLNVNEVGMFYGESSFMSVSRLQGTSDDSEHCSSSVFQCLHQDKPVQMVLEEAYNYLQVGIVTRRHAHIEG